jgi:plastocyanin
MNKKFLIATIVALSLIIALFAPAAAHFEKRPADQLILPLAIKLAPTVHQVEITTTGFNPEEITIEDGDSINWTNQTLETVGLEEGSIFTVFLPLVVKANTGSPVTDSAPSPLPSSAGVSIPAGDSYERNFPTAGDFHFYLQGHTNHHFRITVNAKTNLEVRTITLDPNPATISSTVNLGTEIYNIGLRNAGAFTVSWKLFPLGQSTALDSGSWNVGNLAAGEHTHLATTFTAPQAGPYTVQVIADPVLVVPDSDPANNTRVADFGVSGVINYCADITTNTTWAYALYVLTCDININSGATLTVAPGTIVKFQGVTTIIVNGALSVPATAGQPVFFTSLKDDTVGGDTNNDISATIPAPGDWNSIAVSTGGTVNMAYANVRYGGYNWCGVNCYGYATPLYVIDGGSVVLSHVTFAQNSGYGIDVKPSSTTLLSVTNSTIATSAANGIRVEGIAGKNITITNNTFTGNGASAVSLAFNAGSVTALEGNTGTGNAINGIQLSGALGMDTTLPGNAAFAYVISGGLTVNSAKTLTLSPGAVVKFGSSGETLMVNGSLVASGTEASPVTLTSIHDDTVGGDTNNNLGATAPAPMDWNSLVVSGGGTVNMAYANVRYGGWYWCGVYCYGYNTSLYVFDGGSVVLSHVTFAQNSGYGIDVKPSSTTLLSVTNSTIATSAANGIRVVGITAMNINITNNTFTGNGAAAVSLAFSGGSVTALEGNTGTGNAINGIQMSGNLGMDTTLPGNPVFAYVISGGLTVNNSRTLTLSPGAVVKFGSSGETLMLNGSLVASGTEASPVTLTSIHDDTAGGDTNNNIGATAPNPMDWNSIIASAGGTVNLAYANVRYGGWYWCGVNCYGNNTALHVYDGGSAVLDHVTLAQSGGYGIYVNPSSTSQLSVTNSTIATSAANGIRVEGIAGKNITITNNTFTGNVTEAVWLSFNGGSVTALEGNSGSGNAANGIRLSGALGMDTTLPGNPVFAYVISGGLTVNSAKTLTLSPGVVVKFASSGETLVVDGSLVASGTGPSPVTLTSFKDDTAGGDTNNNAAANLPGRGDWNSIVVSAGGTTSLTYTNLLYGGWYWCGVNCYGNNTTLVLQGTASATISHSILRDSNGLGMVASGNSGTTWLTISDSTIEDNNSTGIDIANSGTYTLTINRSIIRNNTTGINLSGGISATVNHCNIYGNSGLGINNLTPSIVDATDNWWGSDTGPAPSGTGNGVSTNVNYTPWLTAPESLP